MSAAPSVLSYPPGTGIRAGVRAAVGSCAAVLLWGLLGGGATVTLVCVALMSLFLAYGARASWRARERYELTGEGVARLGSASRTLRFGRMSDVRLAYYSTRRDGEGGWMELRVGDEEGTMVFESELEGFPRLAQAVHAAARRSGLALSGPSERNFALLSEGRVPGARRRGFRTIGTV